MARLSDEVDLQYICVSDRKRRPEPSNQQQRTIDQAALLQRQLAQLPDVLLGDCRLDLDHLVHPVVLAQAVVGGGHGWARRVAGTHSTAATVMRNESGGGSPFTDRHRSMELVLRALGSIDGYQSTAFVPQELVLRALGLIDGSGMDQVYQ